MNSSTTRHRCGGSDTALHACIRSTQVACTYVQFVNAHIAGQTSPVVLSGGKTNSSPGDEAVSIACTHVIAIQDRHLALMDPHPCVNPFAQASASRSTSKPATHCGVSPRETRGPEKPLRLLRAGRRRASINLRITHICTTMHIMLGGAVHVSCIHMRLKSC